MYPGKQLQQYDIDNVARKAAIAKQFLKLDGQLYTPGEFKKVAEKRGVTSFDYSFVNPKEIITKRKAELCEYMSKQLLFERKVEDFMAGKIK